MPKCKTEFADGRVLADTLADAAGCGSEGCGTATRRVIPIVPIVPIGQEEPSEDACSGAESFALMVLGDSMEPEFAEGEIVIIEPDGLAVDGSYVLALVNDEWIFRQLRGSEGAWVLHALNQSYPSIPLPDFSAVRGVIIQKAKPGRRRASKRYVD